MEPDSYSQSDSLPRHEKLAAHLERPRTHRYLSWLESLLRRFTPSERLALYAFTAMLGFATVVLLALLNVTISETVPTRGGSLIEGETGPARFINPVLSLSQADQDISALIYSGLMRATPSGTFIPDIAEGYSLSADGTVYTFTIRTGAVFHDGMPVTSEDIAFSIKLAQNPEIRSSHRADWEGVQVSTPDARTVVFTLPRAYAPFMENTTFGILPKHLWKDVSSQDFPFNQLNTHPVGSGPYKIAGVETDATGAPTRYDLVPFEKFTLGAPHIAKLSFILYPDDKSLIGAFNAKTITALAGPSPEQIARLAVENRSLINAPLPRVFAVFFNQSKNPVLADASVRAALNASIDRESIVHNVLNGYGVVLDGPIPPGVLGHPAPAAAIPLIPSVFSTSTPDTARIENARTILAKGGWTWDETNSAWTKKKDTLKITLATADTPELTATAEAITDAWRAAGIQVSTQVYPLSDLSSDVLRPRSYEAVLFGEVIGRDADFFAFWHSKERTDPGLNLALYANAKADTLLSDARAATNKEIRDELYEQFAALVAKDQPAAFLYAPEFLYVIPSTVRGVRLGALTTPSERFLNAYEWYIDTEHVWSFFNNSIN